MDGISFPKEYTLPWIDFRHVVIWSIWDPGWKFHKVRTFDWWWKSKQTHIFQAIYVLDLIYFVINEHLLHYENMLYIFFRLGSSLLLVIQQHSVCDQKMSGYVIRFIISFCSLTIQHFMLCLSFSCFPKKETSVDNKTFF